MKLTPQQKALLSTLQYQFTDDTLFVRALTHSSLGKSSMSNNQRLEFLGDRVLGLIIAERLLEENIEASEGYIHPQFSALVKKETCADIATKIELGESKEQAVIREIDEELNLKIKPIKRFITVKHKYPDFNLVMHSFKCTCDSKKFTLTEHIDFKWMSIENLKSLDWADADTAIVNELIK